MSAQARWCWTGQCGRKRARRGGAGDGRVAGAGDWLPKIGGRRGLAPLLPTLLPSKGPQMGEPAVCAGAGELQGMGGVLPAEILGWDKSAEVATARYTRQGRAKGR